MYFKSFEICSILETSVTKNQQKVVFCLKLNATIKLRQHDLKKHLGMSKDHIKCLTDR